MTKRSTQPTIQQSIHDGQPGEHRRTNRSIGELSPAVVQATPLVIETGRGSYLYDRDGKEYLDGISSLWNVVLGHGRRELTEAAASQMNELAYCSGYAGSSNPRKLSDTIHS